MEFLLEVGRWFVDPANWSGRGGIPNRTWEHVVLSVVPTAIAIVLAMPPATWLAHARRGEFLANAVVNIGRAIPSFGIVVLVAVSFYARGWAASFWPTAFALILLALPPVFTNAYTAIADVDPSAVEAGRGMGLTEREVLTQVELPMGAPVVLAGIRVAFVQVIATVPLAAIVSPGGGYGRYIVDGFATLRSGGDVPLFAGAILVALLTLLAEYAMGLVERFVLPAGARRIVRREDVAETAVAA